MARAWEDVASFGTPHRRSHSTSFSFRSWHHSRSSGNTCKNHSLASCHGTIPLTQETNACRIVQLYVITSFSQLGKQSNTCCIIHLSVMATFLYLGNTCRIIQLSMTPFLQLGNHMWNHPTFCHGTILVLGKHLQNHSAFCLSLIHI